MNVDVVADLIASAPQWSLLVVFLLSFLESLAFVGLLVPGTVLMLFFGALASHEAFSFWHLFVAATLGAFLGDVASFYLGRWADYIFRTPTAEKVLHSKTVLKAERFFERYGSVSVFLGRFIGPIRPIIPFVAGIFRMHPGVFLWWDAVGAIAWSLALLGGGYFFGAAFSAVLVWSSRAALVLVGLLAFLGLLFLLDRLVIRKGRPFFTYMRHLLSLAWQGMRQDPIIAQLLKRHASVLRWIKARFSTKHFFGLPLTSIVILFVYIASAFVGVMESVLQGAHIVAIDERVFQLLRSFYDPQLVPLFSWLTMAGKWFVVVGFAVIVSLLFVLWRMRCVLVPLWTVLIGGMATVSIFKNIIERPRPSYALIAESSYAFPSGHAATAALFYLFVAYVLIRFLKGWQVRVNIFFAALAVVLLVGFTRLYLGVHYWSDVWGGYLLALLWVLLGIALFEWMQQSTHRWVQWSCQLGEAYAKQWGRLARWTITILLLIVAVLYFVASALWYKQERLFPQQQDPIHVVPELSVDVVLPTEAMRYSETLTGARQEPLSFIIAVPSDEDLIALFEKAGWELADRLNSQTVIDLVRAAVTGAPYPEAPMTPSFWNKNVHTFGFQKQLPGQGIRARHHARFWKTNIHYQGLNVYVGTASLDSDIKWFITHSIAPDIDTEREYIFKDLQKTGLLSSVEKVSITKPVLGKNFAGDPFFTDGKAYVIIVKQKILLP